MPCQFRPVLYGLLLFSFLSPASVAAEAPDWNADTLTGDWRGVRTNLSERGITLEIALKVSLLSNLSGGIKRRYGVASGDVNTLDYAYSLGLRYKGLLHGRDEDECGIGLARRPRRRQVQASRRNSAGSQ